MGDEGAGEAVEARGERITNAQCRMPHVLCLMPYAPYPSFYLTPSNSTSKIRVALGGITPPAPRAP